MSAPHIRDRLLLKKNIQIAVAIASHLALVGCSQTGGTTLPSPVDAPSHAPNSRSISLTSAQRQVVEDGVKQMIATPGVTQFSKMSAIANTPAQGIHVCGYVKHKDQNDAQGQFLPFYVELGQGDAKPIAKRGQVGADPSARAKVTFMCRNHNKGG